VEGSAAPKIVSDFLEKEKKDYSRWVPYYATLISIIGFAILLIALAHLPKDLLNYFRFGSVVVFSQFLGIQLFKKSRSSVTFGSVLIIACIPIFGPFPSVILSAIAGLVSIFTDLLIYKDNWEGRASLWRRWSFNTGMYIISSASAGLIFILTGGTVGNVALGSNLLPILLAGLTEFIINHGILLCVLVLQTGQQPFDIWKRDYQWYAPAAIVSGTIGSGLIALTYEINFFIAMGVLFLITSLSYFSSRFYVSNMKEYVEELENANLRLQESQVGLLKTLGTVIDAYDAYTFGHSTQVAVYAEAIAEKMDLKKDEKDLVVKAALVHDIGKVGVMDAIIGKQGKLTDEEYRLVKRHPDIGAEILGLMEGFGNMVPLVRYHHERWDGNGYPMGLKGEEIPLGARILAVADTVDAMFSDRPYRKSPTYDEVMEEILRCMGTQFDPKVVHAFYAVVQERGPSFFKNSANIVDHKVQRQDAAAIGENVRYLKRSMLGEVQEALEQEKEVEVEVSQD
jgi:HD-GYP domain-containing protein (c-di-GMP phosphodiesterase class II)